MLNNKIRPVFKKGRFFNSHEEVPKSSIGRLFYTFHSIFHEIVIFFVSLRNGNKRLLKNINDWQEKTNKVLKKSSDPLITWIGHATFLIQIDGVNILTDPIFGNATFLFPRILPPGISIDNLPQIDYVLISHNHLDHMDSKSLNSLKHFNPNIKILVPYGDKKWFDKRNFKEVYESIWWESHKFNIKSVSDFIKFTFLPSYHWTQRGLFDQNKSLWGSWMIESKKGTIYFAGDTAYSYHFKNIAQEFTSIDVALMPIGPCEPRFKMCRSHISAEEAGQAFLDLNAQNLIPMHWGTFHFGTDNFDTPINRLKAWWFKNPMFLSSKFLHAMKIGQSILLGKTKPEVIIPKIDKVSDIQT